MIACGLSTTSTGPLVGATYVFSNPGSFTSSAASGGTRSALKAPSASVLISTPRTTIEAPASGLRSASRMRPVTIGEGQGVSEVGSTGRHGLGAAMGARTSGAGLACSTGGVTAILAGVGASTAFVDSPAFGVSAVFGDSADFGESGMATAGAVGVTMSVATGARAADITVPTRAACGADLDPGDRMT